FILAAVSCSPQSHTPGHRTTLIDNVTSQLPSPPPTTPTLAEATEPASPRVARGEVHDRIVHAAGELFAERGFDNTSLQDIGDAVGVLKGSLYHYISSKEDLLYAVIQHGHEGLLENVRMCKELRAGPAETLVAFAVGHITLNVHPDRYQRGIVFLRDSARLKDDKRQAVIRDRDAYTEYLQQIIRDGQRRKVFCPDLDVRLTSYAILGVLNSFHRWYRPTGKSSPTEIARQFSAFILAAVSCSPQSHTPGHRTTLIDNVTSQLPSPPPTTRAPSRRRRRSSSTSGG
ncbi:TetR/AcrR family transcriptional regulator, partial [Mycobacterium sp. CVI_P3]